MHEVHNPQEYQKQEGEIIIAITEDDLVIAVDALWAKSAEAKRQLRAPLLERLDIHEDIVGVLGQLEFLYDGLASDLIDVSSRSWKGSDAPLPEREVLDMARIRYAVSRAVAVGSEAGHEPYSPSAES